MIPQRVATIPVSRQKAGHDGSAIREDCRLQAGSCGCLLSKTQIKRPQRNLVPLRPLKRSTEVAAFEDSDRHEGLRSLIVARVRSRVVTLWPAARDLLADPHSNFDRLRFDSAPDRQCENSILQVGFNRCRIKRLVEPDATQKLTAPMLGVLERSGLSRSRTFRGDSQHAGFDLNIQVVMRGARNLELEYDVVVTFPESQWNLGADGVSYSTADCAQGAVKFPSQLVKRRWREIPDARKSCGW
jgi:hypothetical protein